mgnify:FL=1
MPYTIRFTPAAARQLARLDAPIRRRLASAIDGLSVHPRPPGVKKLSGPADLWRVRVGDYRILYRIVDRELVIVIVTIGHRGDVYR